MAGKREATGDLFRTGSTGQVRKSGLQKLNSRGKAI